MALRKLTTGIFLAGVLALGATPALASSTSPDGGAYVYDSGSTLYVKDAKADGHGAYGHANTTNSRLRNHSGYGTTVSRNVGFSITAVQACTQISFAPDPCGSWG